MTRTIYGEMEFHKKLRLHMKELRLSQDDVAERMSVSQGLVSRWVRGENNPDVFQAFELSKILKIPLDYLVDGSKGPLDVEQQERLRMAMEIIDRYGAIQAYWWLVEASKGGGPTQGLAEPSVNPMPMRTSGSRPEPKADKKRSG